MTDAEGNELTATYSEKSLDDEGKATFTLAKDEKLVDATEYAVTGDLIEDTSFLAKVGGIYVAEFIKVTEEIPANIDEKGNRVDNDDKKDAKITVAAKDQYGDAITLVAGSTDVKATLNGMALSTEEVSRAGETVTIDKGIDLREGDVLVLTLTEKDGDKVLAETELTYTVGEYVEAVVTTIELTTKENKTSVPYGTEIEFTAKMFDQFKSPINGDLRWVVNGSVVGGTGTTYKMINKTPAGEYKVEVFAKDNSKVSAAMTVTVGAAELTELTFADTLKDLEENVVDLGEVIVTTDKYNNENLVLGTLVPNKGAALLASNVKFHVTTTDTDLKGEDITVTAKDVTAKDGKKVVLVEAKSTKAGTFQVTAYVGAAVDAEGVAKTTAFPVTTEVRTDVASISKVEFDAAELKVGETLYKEVTIKNKHGEVLNAEQAKEDPNGLQVSFTNSDIYADGISPVLVPGDKDLDQDVDKTYLKLKATEAGTSVITLQAGAVVTTTTVKFVAPVLTEIKVAEAKVTGVVAGDKEASIYKLVKVDFLDQDGQEMTSHGVTDADITVKDAEGEKALKDLVKLTSVKKNETTDELEAGGDNGLTHLKVSPEKDLGRGTFTVEIKKIVDGKEVKAEFQVVVGEAREIKTIELGPETTKLAVGGEATLNIVTKDQYGDFIKATATAVSAKTEVLTVGSVESVEKDGKTIGYKVEVTAVVAGSSEVTVTVDEITAKVTFTVDAAGNLVNSVEINTKDIEDLYFTGKTGEEADGEETIVTKLPTTVELSATAKDATSNAIPGTPFAWSVTEIKDAQGKVLSEGVLVDDNGVVTADHGFVGSATIQVMSVKVGGTTTTDTITLNFDKAASAAVMDTVKLVQTVEEEEVEVTKLEIKVPTAIKIVAKDQYGEDFDFTGKRVQTLVSDSTIVTAVNVNGIITLTPVKGAEGTTTVMVNYNGKTLVVEVTAQ